MMANIVKWCNDNQGFVTAIFSALSLSVSLIAIWISIRTSKMPYTKVGIINGSMYMTTDGESGVAIDFINGGHIGIRISMIGLLIDGKQYINRFTISESQKLVDPSDSVTHRLSFNDIIQSLKITNPAKNKKVYVYAKDAQGKIYKKYYCRVNQLYQSLK